LEVLAKIHFSAFSVRFGVTILKNDGVEIFPILGDFLLLWQHKALSNQLNVAITEAMCPNVLKSWL